MNVVLWTLGVIMTKVDLNCDLGESFGAYVMGCDAQILPKVSSVNIACGFHSGDAPTMAKTVNMAKKCNVSIGAHPSFPDLLGFGRREMHCDPADVKAYVQYQIGALLAFTQSAGVPLRHVKPHGALYNMAAKDPVLAQAIADAVFSVDSNLILLALAGSELIKASKSLGLTVAEEVFADRGYLHDGSLVPRNQEGAVLHDPCVVKERTLRMVKNGAVITNTGEEISINAHSICVHGDNPSAVAFVDEIRTALESEDIMIAPL